MPLIAAPSITCLLRRNRRTCRHRPFLRCRPKTGLPAQPEGRLFRKQMGLLRQPSPNHQIPKAPAAIKRPQVPVVPAKPAPATPKAPPPISRRWGLYQQESAGTDRPDAFGRHFLKEIRHESVVWIVILFCRGPSVVTLLQASILVMYVVAGQTMLRMNLHAFVLGLIIAVVILYFLVPPDSRFD